MYLVYQIIPTFFSTLFFSRVQGFDLLVTYRSAARNVLGIGLGPLQKRLHFLPRVVAGVVVGPHDAVDDFGVVVQFTHDFGLLRFHPRGLHSSQDLGFLSFRHSTESHSCNNA